MKKNKVIAVVGMPGAGKTEAAMYLLKLGLNRVYFGDCCFDEIKKRGLKTDAKIEKEVREDLRKKYGMGAFAILSMPKIKDAYKKGDVVIESMYSWEEYKIVKEKYKKYFKVIAICANTELRHKRLTGRKELKHGVARKFSMKDAEERDFVQIENIATGGPIAIADYIILNEGSKKDLFENLEKILKKEKVKFKK